MIFCCQGLFCEDTRLFHDVFGISIVDSFCDTTLSPQTTLLFAIHQTCSFPSQFRFIAELLPSIPARIHMFSLFYVIIQSLILATSKYLRRVKTSTDILPLKMAQYHTYDEISNEVLLQFRRAFTFAPANATSMSIRFLEHTGIVKGNSQIKCPFLLRLSEHVQVLEGAQVFSHRLHHKQH